MVAAVGLDEVADFSHLQGERGVLEGLLHLSFPEVPQVSPFGAARALRVLEGDVGEGFGVLFEFFLEGSDVGDGFFSGASDIFVAVAVLGPAGLPVLLKDVGAVDLH